MAEEKTEHQESETRKGRRRLRWWMAVAMVAAAVLGLLWISERVTLHLVDDRLAAIEAARAIPDEENAAIIYHGLLEKCDEASLSPEFLDDRAEQLTRYEPWSSKDNPELATWLKGHEGTISTLVEASKKEKCRFPISTTEAELTNRIDRLRTMRKWSFLLLRAGNNDISEGRTEAGLDKCLTALRIANHLHQQPMVLDFLIGIAVEGVTLGRMRSFILEGHTAESHLKAVEAALAETTNTWAGHSTEVLDVETLYETRHRNLYERVKLYWQDLADTPAYDRVHELYSRVLADRRGIRILIELRRYSNREGRWPETLDEIESLAPAEAFIDPMNGGAFVYRLTDDNFMLYSKGSNNIDENGQRRRDADDWLIWPPTK